MDNSKIDIYNKKKGIQYADIKENQIIDPPENDKKDLDYDTFMRKLEELKRERDNIFK